MSSDGLWIPGARHVWCLADAGFQAYLFDNHSRFAVPGWQLDSSWILCTVSGAVAVLTAVGVAVSAYVLPPEDGYEFLA